MNASARKGPSVNAVQWLGFVGQILYEFASDNRIKSKVRTTEEVRMPDGTTKRVSTWERDGCVILEELRKGWRIPHRIPVAYIENRDLRKVLECLRQKEMEIVVRETSLIAD